MASWATDLRIYEIESTAAIGLPPYAARGLQGSLEPIAESAAGRRAVAGNWRNLAPTQFKLLRLTFSCLDQQLPPLLFPADERTIEAMIPMYHVEGGSPLRTARTTMNTGSTMPATETADGWTLTYSVLNVVVVEPMRMGWGEWAAEATWEVVFEEIGGA